MNAWFALLVRRRWLVLILALAGAVGGIVNLEGLSIDAVPDISPKQVMVLTLSRASVPWRSSGSSAFRSRTPWPARRG